MVCHKSTDMKLPVKWVRKLATIPQDGVLEEKPPTEVALQNKRTYFQKKETLSKNLHEIEPEESLFTLNIDRVFITVVYSGAFTAFIGVIDENYPIIILGGAVVFACCAGMSYIERYQN